MHDRFQIKPSSKYLTSISRLAIGINLYLQKQQSSSYLAQNCTTTLKQIEVQTLPLDFNEIFN